MKPAPFVYHDPSHLGEALELLARWGEEAKPIAGGQSLVPLLNMRLARPQVLVDLNRIAGLNGIRIEDGAIAIGAMTRKVAVERCPLVRERLPLLDRATRLVAHPQIRSRSTVGGSMAQADPAAEYPAVALLLDAEMRVASVRGERALPAEAFFVTALTTALEPDELLVEVRFPLLKAGTGTAIEEVSRRHGDFAIAGCAAAVALDASGRVGEARLALFGVEARPLRLRSVEEGLVGEQPTRARLREAAAEVARGLEDPLADTHATADFRRHLAAVMTRRALERAVTEAAAV